MCGIYPLQSGKTWFGEYTTGLDGVTYLQLLFEPLVSKRHIQVTAQQPMKEFAYCMKWLMDNIYLQGEVIHVVLDNLGIHKPAAMYPKFSPQEMRWILRKLEFHLTLKQGSWLNMAEIDLGVFGRTMKNYIPEEQFFEERPKYWQLSAMKRMQK